MEDELEVYDGFPEPLADDSDLMKQILAEKKGEPNKYASYWEQDEDDIDAPTEEEIQNSPVLRTLWAAENGEIEIVKELLEGECGNDLLQCQDSDGYTPLHRASYNGHLTVIQYLLERGASANAQTHDGWTPLHSTAAWGQHAAAVILLSYGADINARTHGGQTPLHLAACPEGESLALLETFLLHRRLDPAIRNTLGETARDLALRSSRYHALFETCDEGVNCLYASSGVVAGSEGGVDVENAENVINATTS